MMYAAVWFMEASTPTYQTYQVTRPIKVTRPTNSNAVFLAAIKQPYERSCPSAWSSVRRPIFTMLLPSYSDVHTKGQDQRSRSQISKQILQQLGHFRIQDVSYGMSLLIYVRKLTAL